MKNIKQTIERLEKIDSIDLDEVQKENLYLRTTIMSWCNNNHESGLALLFGKNSIQNLIDTIKEITND